MKFIECKLPCPLCGNEMTLQADPSCPSDTADKLSKLVICNHCADFKAATHWVEKRLGWLCGRVLAERGSKLPPEERKRTEEAITLATKQFARAYAAYYRNPALAWHPEFVSLLMDKPDRWPDILHAIRNELKKQQKQRTAYDATHPQQAVEERADLRATQRDEQNRPSPG